MNGNETCLRKSMVIRLQDTQHLNPGSMQSQRIYIPISFPTNRIMKQGLNISYTSQEADYEGRQVIGTTLPSGCHCHCHRHVNRMVLSNAISQKLWRVSASRHILTMVYSDLVLRRRPHLSLMKRLLGKFSATSLELILLRSRWLIRTWPNEEKVVIRQRDPIPSPSLRSRHLRILESLVVWGSKLTRNICSCANEVLFILRNMACISLNQRAWLQEEIMRAVSQQGFGGNHKHWHGWKGQVSIKGQIELTQVNSQAQFIWPMIRKGSTSVDPKSFDPEQGTGVWSVGWGPLPNGDWFTARGRHLVLNNGV